MPFGRSKIVAALALSAVPFLVVACGGGSDPTPAPEPTATPTPVPAPTPTAGIESGGQVTLPTLEPEPAATIPPLATQDALLTPEEFEVELARRYFGSHWKTDFSKRTVSFDEIISGGPPRDGIPPIYDPVFVGIDRANEWMIDLEAVIVVQIGDDVRAYSQDSLVSHEVVDDVVGGRPIAVTWCPLCNTALAFDREVDGRVLTFGVSGLLRQSNMIMWDHETESWWQQGTGEAIVGSMAGMKLEFIPAQVVTWRDFKAAFPEGIVLAIDTASHGFNPYVRYDSGLPYLYSGATEVDSRLPVMERVVGVSVGEDVRAYPFTELAKDRVVQETVGGQRLVLFYEPRGLSNLDSFKLEEARNVGTSSVFVPRVDDMELTFEFKDNGFEDRETGSRWNMLGQAISGPLEGKAMPSFFNNQALWFYMAATQENITIYKSESSE
ncbi:MAG: DUF3179 domain-containing protein [Chloroflexi bacterium]|nr:DUF3179 domain-containing protein [Chloroflexota bacterium]